MCGLAGALFAGLFVQFDQASFPVDASIQVVAIAVIGGLGAVAGPLLGALYVIGVPAIFGSDANVSLATSGIGLLILLMYFPGGLVGIVYRARDSGVRLGRRYADGRSPMKHLEPTVAAHPDAQPTERRAASAKVCRLSGSNRLQVRFGGVVAVDGVSIEVEQGEIVGPDRSERRRQVHADERGEWLRALPARSRSSAHRSGGDHRPAPRRARSRPDVPERRPLPGPHRPRNGARRARGAPAHLALAERSSARLGRGRDERTQERRGRRRCSTCSGSVSSANRSSPISRPGTRRITELACLLALEAKVLCLDEPTAGVAQRETEAFGPLLRRIREELDASVLIVEHDMPLIMSISDRVYCIESGQVIAVGHTRRRYATTRS